MVEQKDLKIKEFNIDGKVPDDIIEAQKQIKSKSIYNDATLHLFFSFDIVNSTRYKTMTGNWTIVLKELLDLIRKKVSQMSEIGDSILWRVIGDEIVFVTSIQNKEGLKTAVTEIFEVMCSVCSLLKYGKFFDLLLDKGIDKREVSILKLHNILSIKSVAWIASVSNDVNSVFDNIVFDYKASTRNQDIREYLGKDIDTGFRLKSYTQDRRLLVSFEIAYFLKDNNKNELHIIDYVKLKGVWNECMYPIIWYYNQKTYSDTNIVFDDNTKQIPFDESFRYDESENNDIVKRYLNRKNIIIDNNCIDVALSEDMYKINTALDKIILDRCLEQKMNYLDSLFDKKSISRVTVPESKSLEMTCSVVCYDITNNKILIAKRNPNRSTNPNKWEFGTVKIQKDEKLISTVEEYYKSAFGVKISLVLDDTRCDVQPVPVSIYEVQKPDNIIKKGVILVARLEEQLQNNSKLNQHTDVKWVTREDAYNYEEDDVVPDFHNTLDKVFGKLEEYFKVRSDTK